VLINRPTAPVEIYNDVDLRITRLFRVLRDHGDEFRKRLKNYLRTLPPWASYS
jgi:hypothetical protein